MILLSYGTRPEWIKIKPLIKELSGVLPFKVLYTGQHTHIANFYYDYRLDINDGNNRLDSIISSIVNIGDEVFDGIKYTIVQGDTASTYAVALASFNRKIKVVHLEAGLRTYDLENPYPEEAYRQMISRIASIHFCATENNRTTLLMEKCGGKIYIVGNTVLDNLVGIDTSYGDEVLVTMHRRENHNIMSQWFNELNSIAGDNKDLKFTIPLHPTPNVKKHAKLLTNFNIVDPLPYDKMIDKISKCKMLISDSGGIQEESSFLNKKVIVCRKYTERQESVGKHSIMCSEPRFLKNVFKKVINNYKINSPCPYGNGRASKLIVQRIIGENNEIK